MKRLYAESSERDGDSSLSYSHSYSDKQLSGSHSYSHRHSHSHPHSSHQQQLQQHHQQQQQHQQALQSQQNSPPATKRLDMSKNSMSSPAVGVSVPHAMPESPSMGSMQLQSSSCTIQTPQQQLQQQQQQPLPAPPQVASTSTAAAAAAQKLTASEMAQDNSITSEPSETTTTTTTTSEDVVTTYKETSQHSAANGVATASNSATPANGNSAAAANSSSAASSSAAAGAETGITQDAKRLQYLFNQLADCKNDTEQLTWMLYEDEENIIQFLEELVEILNNADENIMSCDQYQMFINLVQYYQMETRWSIKRLLLQTFTAACHLDHIIVDILLTSGLPLEIVEDMKAHFANLNRFKQLVKMLTIIFSLGQLMPVNHQDYLGVHFASFLLEIVEGNNPEVLVDMVIALILAFNQQFSEHAVNVIIEAMQNLPTAKVFTEKLLLLLNREDDPTRLLKHHNEHTVLRMFIDIFSHPDTAGMFYTNDIKVLIDIVVRQFSDLDAGNVLRPCYLELCRRILRNTNYHEHQHRLLDLMKIFIRIFCEETECSASDQQLVREIVNEFPQLFKA